MCGAHRHCSARNRGVDVLDVVIVLKGSFVGTNDDLADAGASHHKDRLGIERPG
jgi:hypothetical protein